jgi:hypothetical protein
MLYKQTPSPSPSYKSLVPYRCNSRGQQVLYPSAHPSIMFSGLCSVISATIALKLCIWLYIYDFQISSKIVAINLFLEELCPLNLAILRDFTVFRTFFSLLTDIHLIFGTLLYNTKIQIKFEFGIDTLIISEVMTLGLRKIPQIISFPHLFSLCVHIFI